MSNFFIVNVEAAIYHEGNYLIIRRSEKEEHAGGLYSLVGGKVDFDDSSLSVLEENIKREVSEEIGIDLNGELKYVHSTTFSVEDVQVLDLVFLSTNFAGRPYIKSEDEIAEIKWMSFEEIQESTEIPPWTKKSIEMTEKLLEKTWN
ncbi:NUDIX hydrolase [Alkalihalobacillus sp. R86527]|uniref:NUDIX hydrolase n=1 Tax=Alkalihalobacillus sp. R86527 TaxID=3093863 RepID=UPI00366C86B1